MKEFKRQEGNGCNIVVDCSAMRCGECKKIKKAMWRAALEWMYKQLEKEGTYPYGTSGHELTEDIKEIINQELSNNQTDNSTD